MCSTTADNVTRPVVGPKTGIMRKLLAFTLAFLALAVPATAANDPRIPVIELSGMALKGTNQTVRSTFGAACCATLAVGAPAAPAEFALPGPAAYVGAPVVCGSMPAPNLLAYTDLVDRRIVLGEGACWGIVALWQDPNGLFSDTWNPGHDIVLLEALGAIALMHESGHLLFGADETQAECYGLAAVPALLSKLGVPTARQRAILADVSAIHAQLGAAYHGSCALQPTRR